MVRTRNVSFKLILCSIEDDTTTFNLFIDRKKYRALQLAIAAVKLATQSICISTFNTLTDDMSDAESDPDDEYEEEEGDEIMLEFMSTN